MTMYKKIIFAIFFLGLTLCFSCKQTEADQNQDKIVQDEVLDNFFQELYEKKMFNGAVAVKKKGKLILKKGYGRANFRFNHDFKPETQMEVASVSKQFTAAAIMILKQEGKLEIDDTVQNYLGEDFPYPQITIKHLLNHTSGLVNYATYFRQQWDSTQIAYNKDILAYFKREKPKLETAPGEKYKYSNSGYVLLAEIVEAISGLPLDEFLQDRIFQPADMNSTAFYERDTIWKMEAYAPGYMWDMRTCDYVKPENLPEKYYYRFLSGRFGSGRLSSNVNDLIKWDSILYQNEIISEKSKQEIFQVHQPEKDTSDYGFGWHIYDDSDLGKVVYHTGSWAGNLAFIKRFVEDKSLIVILNNTHSPYMKEIRAEVEKYLKGEKPEIPKQKLAALLRKEICQLHSKNIQSWFESIAEEVEIDSKALSDLERAYRELKENEKADWVEKLMEIIQENKGTTENDV